MQVEVREDEGIRPGTTVERLAKLKPSFTETGSTTAGNSSQASRSTFPPTGWANGTRPCVCALQGGL